MRLQFAASIAIRSFKLKMKQPKAKRKSKGEKKKKEKKKEEKQRMGRVNYLNDEQKVNTKTGIRTQASLDSGVVS